MEAVEISASTRCSAWKGQGGTLPNVASRRRELQGDAVRYVALTYH